MDKFKLDKKDVDLFRQLTDKDNIMIITHRGPDGDALGSAFALSGLLKNLNKNVTVACSDEVPKKLRFISDGKSSLDPDFEPQIIITVDTATEKLMGKKYENLADKVFLSIDHHVTNSGYAANTILYPHLSSVGELMYLLIIQSGFEIDEYIASKLYCAISFDTGCFKFSNVTANTHLIAAELLQFNLPCSKMNRMMFDSVPLEQLKIENLILRNAELHYDNKIALVCLTQEMVKSIGAKDDDFDGLTALTRRIEGPAVGITMREMPDGSIRVSLRAESDFDVSKVAMKFGGGGHVKAAGCTVNLDMETAKKQIVQAVIGEWTK